MKNKLIFENNQKFLQCPLCKEDFTLEKSLICKNNHCFDISSKGYVNFIPSQKEIKGYDLSFFQNRQMFLEKGFYNHILDEIINIISNEKNILDAGCGEGFYSKGISEKNRNVFGLDFSKDAIKISSKGINNVFWLVADITNIPLKNNSIDCILNIFTPANYKEFNRILSDNGTILKVIPGENHLKELRNLLGNQLSKENYSNEDVFNYFEKHFELINSKVLNKTFNLNKNDTENLLQMTPLTFNLNKPIDNLENLNKITIEGKILVGKIKKRS